jgi:FliI/YscN family ATPase
MVGVVKPLGAITDVKSSSLEATLSFGRLNDVCIIRAQNGNCHVRALISEVNQDIVHLSPLDDIATVAVGDIVYNSLQSLTITINTSGTKHNVFDAFCKPFQRESHSGKLSFDEEVILKLECAPPNPLEKIPISEQFQTGIRSIDALLPLGIGQRVGIFAEAGIGKSTLIQMILNNASYDRAVVALIGERGREVSEFVAYTKKSRLFERINVVVSTADEIPQRRYNAFLTATALSEFYRDSGENVLLVVDSLTRVARALRDIALSQNEIPVANGYPPSVLTKMPQILERHGNSLKGKMTSLYTVLLQDEREGDFFEKEIKSLLDGHIYLTQRMYALGIRPSVDPLKSISRVAERLTGFEERQTRREFLRLFHRYIYDRDLFFLGGGAYDHELTSIIENQQYFRNFMLQESETAINSHDINHVLKNILKSIIQAKEVNQ